MKGATLAAVTLLVAASAQAQARPSPHVSGVLGATSDAWDVAAFGGRTLVATSGGLVVLTSDPIQSSDASVSGVANGNTQLRADSLSRIRSLGVADGLPGGRCRSVSVVGDDVWVGTVEGAARLDVNLRVVERADVRRVSRAVSFAGSTWLASFGDGLFRGSVHVALGASGARDRVADLRVVGSELWVATAGAGILRVDAMGHVAGRITSVHGLPDDVVLGLADGGDGSVLVSTMSGPALVHGTHVASSAALVALAAALPVHDVRAVARDARGGLWAATWGGGVWAVHAGVATRVGGDALHARRVVADGDGVDVVAEDGTFRMAAGRAPTSLVAGGLPSGDVTCFATAFGSLWAGTFAQGLARLALDATHADAQPAVTTRFGVDARVNDLAVTRDAGGGETLWIATDRGLYATDGRSYWPVENPQAPPRGHVLALVATPGGDLWAASSREVSRLHAGRWHAFTGTSRVPLVSVDALALGADGTVWLGTLHGLVALDPRTGALIAHTVASGVLPVDWVTALVARGGSIIAGTYHGGLVELRADGTTRVVREGERGLASGWVNPHALAVIDDQLWVGTLDRGLYVGDLDHGFTRVVGLPSEDVTSFRHDLVATRAGIARLE